MAFLYTAGAVVLLAAAVSYLCYRATFAVPRKMTVDAHDFQEEHLGDLAGKIHAMISDVQKLEYQDVYIESEDHLRLHGKYYHVRDGAPTEILFHGYRSIAERDFCGGLPLALRAGHNALLVDQRAHGKSEGRALSFGILERRDVLSWIDYIRERSGENTQILLVGISMGAATVLMAGGLPLPENVAGIIADCGYTSPSDIIRKVAADRHYPVNLIYFFIRLGGRIFGGFDIEEDSAESAMAGCRVPVLFLHGEADGFVPCEMSRRNFEAKTGKKMIATFPGADHALSYLIDPERYRNIIAEFCRTSGL